MKKTLRDIPAIIADGFNGYKSALFYGEDYGLASELFTKSSVAVHKDLNDSFSVFTFESDDVKDAPEKLFNEIQSISFMGGRKLIRIKSATNKIADILEEAFEKFEATDVFICVIAGELDGSSKLKKLYESAKKKDIVGLGCYLESGTTRQFIMNELKTKGFSISSDALNYLEAHLGENRLSTKSELEKLSLYMFGSKEISMADVSDCVGDSSVLHFQDLSFTLANLDAKKSVMLYDRLLENGESPIGLLRILMNTLRKVYDICVEVEMGETAQNALKKNGVVFWKTIPVYTKLISIWDTRKLSIAFDMLQNLDLKMKEKDAQIELMFSQFILEFCTKLKKI